MFHQGDTSTAVVAYIFAKDETKRDQKDQKEAAANMKEEKEEQMQANEERLHKHDSGVSVDVSKRKEKTQYGETEEKPQDAKKSKKKGGSFLQREGKMKKKRGSRIRRDKMNEEGGDRKKGKEKKHEQEKRQSDDNAETDSSAMSPSVSPSLPPLSLTSGVISSSPRSVTSISSSDTLANSQTVQTVRKDDIQQENIEKEGERQREGREEEAVAQKRKVQESNAEEIALKEHQRTSHVLLRSSATSDNVPLLASPAGSQERRSNEGNRRCSQDAAKRISVESFRGPISFSTDLDPWVLMPPAEPVRFLILLRVRFHVYHLLSCYL